MSKATTITIDWDDGTKHVYERERDDIWNLRIYDDEILNGSPLIVGCKREDIERVLNTGFEGTPDVATT